MSDIYELEKASAVKLDLQDRKLLFALDFDARATLSSLAKKARMSKQGVDYKIKNLTNSGVIKGFYPVVNVPRLGFIYCRILLTFQNRTIEVEKKIFSYLKDHEKVFWLFLMQGQFDALVVIWVRHISEINDFLDQLYSKFGAYIKGREISLATDVIHYQHRYLMGVEETREMHIKETDELVGIDRLDSSIINKLSENARATIVDIADSVRASPRVVAYRLRKMEDNGLIAGYRAAIDYSKLGLTYYKVFLALSSAPLEEKKKLLEYIRSSPIVIYRVEGIGLHAEIDFEVIVGSELQLSRFMKELSFKFPGIVGEYSTVMFIEMLKVRYMPSLRSIEKHGTGQR